MTQDKDIVAHVAYFASLISIYEFYEHTGLPAPAHIRDLLMDAQAGMEDLTKEPPTNETGPNSNDSRQPEARADLESGEPSRRS